MMIVSCVDIIVSVVVVDLIAVFVVIVVEDVGVDGVLVGEVDVVVSVDVAVGCDGRCC